MPCGTDFAINQYIDWALLGLRSTPSVATVSNQVPDFRIASAVFVFYPCLCKSNIQFLDLGSLKQSKRPAVRKQLMEPPSGDGKILISLEMDSSMPIRASPSIMV